MSSTPQARPLRKEGQRRRRQIIEATLQLIARDGVRAVRHRAVAAEAGVPLAATTYYFRDMGQLLRDSFAYFAVQRAAAVTAVRATIAEHLQAARETAGPDAAEQLAERVSTALADYVLGQAGARDDRAIELAFRHEARRDAGLRALSLEQERQFAADIESLLQRVGSADAFADAQITLGVIYRLEAEAAFSDLSEAEVRRIVARHVHHLMGLVARVA